jgi:hypothetical protein
MAPLRGFPDTYKSVYKGDNYQYTTYPIKIDYYRLQLQLLLLVVLTIGMIITAGYQLKLIKTNHTDKLEM